ncbi:hypothetical protein SKAU_G00056230 [Synaphobranchus kaupii]|uniref:Uncharacterized protein n=1 Tax=Synaphobranchus kaupii TaxID=118154 RepID=A0A9Q1G4V1_SYNKA|nr:hypothetical protein SKAU_G00056230 [Synaphobranchus kaupii]
MDPADPAQVRVALEQQGALLGHHQAHLDTVTENIQTLASSVANLTMGGFRRVATDGPKIPPPVFNHPPPYPTSDFEPEAMQINRTRLTKAERERRMATRACLYCGPTWALRRKLPGKSQTPTSESRSTSGHYSGGTLLQETHLPSGHSRVGRSTAQVFCPH